MEECPFCNIKKEEILYETKNFVVKPSIGPIVEGYLLICSKKHLIGLSKMPKEIFSELEDIKSKIKKIFKETYKKPTIFFEHGPINENINAGSCIDHAHLHAIPFNTDIKENISRNFQEKEIESMKEITKQEENKIPYFYYENQEGKKFIFEIPFPVPRQYLRQIIASKTKFPERWNWKIYPETNIFNKTLKTLNRHNLIESQWPKVH